MSDAANATSTDNNGDSGLNGKLKCQMTVPVSVCFLSAELVGVRGCMFIISLLRVFQSLKLVFNTLVYLPSPPAKLH